MKETATGDELALFRSQVAAFVETEVRPRAEQWEAQGFTPKSLWKRCGELGFLGILYPESYGGQDADYRYSTIFCEEIAQCGSPGVALGLIVQTHMATPALAWYGSDFLKDRYLRRAISGDMVGSIAITEPDSGSDVASLRTFARVEGEGYRINGQKLYITNGTQADSFTLLALTSEEGEEPSFSLFVVPGDADGIERSKPMNKTCYPSSDTAGITFDNVYVSKDHIIGDVGRGFKYQMEQFQHERLAGVVMALGMLKHAYRLTQNFACERYSFGRSIANFQITRHKLADMISKIEMLGAFVDKCVDRAVQGVDFTREVSMLKLVGAKIAQDVLGECVQIHGGAGLMQEYIVARYFRDSKLFSIGGGTDEIMKEIIAKYEER